MDNERLIEEVRTYPVLYDLKNDRYRNAEHKEKIWKQIAKNLNAKGGIDECKRKWSQMRDQLRKTLKKRMTSVRQGSILRKYKYEDELYFLIPHMTELFSFKDDGEYAIDEQDSSEIKQDSDNEVASNKEEDFEIDSPVNEAGNMSSSISPNISSIEFSPTRNSKRKDRFTKPRILKRKFPSHIRPQSSAVSQLMSYILEEKEAERNAKKATHEKDSVDAFLGGISPSLKTLNPILLNQAKSRIFSVVQEFEMKQLMGQTYAEYGSYGNRSSISPSSPARSSLAADGFQIHEPELSFQPPLNVIPKSEFDIAQDHFQ